MTKDSYFSIFSEKSLDLIVTASLNGNSKNRREISKNYSATNSSLNFIVIIDLDSSR